MNLDNVDIQFPIVLLLLFAIADFIFSRKVRMAMESAYAVWKGQIAGGFEASGLSREEALLLLERRLSSVDGVARFEKMQVVGPLLGVVLGAFNFATIEVVSVPALQPLAWGVACGSLCALIHAWFSSRIDGFGLTLVRKGVEDVDKAWPIQPLKNLADTSVSLRDTLVRIEESLDTTDGTFRTAASGVADMARSMTGLADQVQRTLEMLQGISYSLQSTQDQANTVVRAMGEKIETAFGELKQALDKLVVGVEKSGSSFSSVSSDLLGRQTQSNEELKSSLKGLKDAAKAVSSVGELLDQMKMIQSTFGNIKEPLCEALRSGLQEGFARLDEALKQSADTSSPKAKIRSTSAPGGNEYSMSSTNVDRRLEAIQESLSEISAILREQADRPTTWTRVRTYVSRIVNGLRGRDVEGE